MYHENNFSCISDLSSITAPNLTNERTNNRNIGDLTFKTDKDSTEKRISPDGTRKLQDEINMLTKRNCELESQLRSLDATGHIRDPHSIDTLDTSDTGK